MDSWKKVWREGLAPVVSDEGLEALRQALLTNDRRLGQGFTTQPPPLQCIQDWPCECACIVAYTGWIGDGLRTVGEVEEYFARMCYTIDQAIGEPGGCRYLLNWWDQTNRATALKELLPEVMFEIERRELWQQNQQER